MKLPFYAQFLIRAGISILEAFVMGNTHLTDLQKADIDAAIKAGEKVLTDFGG